MQMISHLLLAAAMLGTVSLVVSGESFFSFYKLSLQWPQAACSDQKKKCVPYIPDKFTIHGLWPQEANDAGVKPYYPNNRNCTTDTPTPEQEIIDILDPIRSELNIDWPNLYLNRCGQSDNLTFWRYEWSSHGMCSDYPNNPLAYFNKTLQLAKQYNPLQVTGIQRGSVGKVKEFVEIIRTNLKARPQIACSMVNISDPKGKNNSTKMVWEIRFCFKRPKPDGRGPFPLINCPNVVYRDGKSSCKSEDDEVMFAPPRRSSANIIRDEL